ncbi:MAG: hypothetical protein Q4D02_02620 [Clostridia bacterium]|nr:hypothetical protein [Clostridia bacterium]
MIQGGKWKIFLGIVYYIVNFIFFFYLYIFAVLVGTIIDFSSILFNICFIFLPIILLIIPLVCKLMLKRNFYKSILIGIISIMIYFIFLFMMKFGINCYFKSFTSEKWSNDTWHTFRYIMLDDLEEKYCLEGMTKSEIYEILGKPDQELEKSNGECTICYSIKNEFLEGDYYHIYLNENNVVIRTSVEHWN